MTSAGGWTTPVLGANGSSHDLRMEVTPGVAVADPLNTQFIAVSSTADATKEDVVEAVTSTTIPTPPGSESGAAVSASRLFRTFHLSTPLIDAVAAAPL